VIAKAFSAGFHRIAHLVRPLPVGSSDRVTKSCRRPMCRTRVTCGGRVVHPAVSRGAQQRPRGRSASLTSAITPRPCGRAASPNATRAWSPDWASAPGSHAIRHYSATEPLASGVDLRTAERLGQGSGGAATLKVSRHGSAVPINRRRSYPS